MTISRMISHTLVIRVMKPAARFIVLETSLKPRFVADESGYTCVAIGSLSLSLSRASTFVN